MNKEYWMHAQDLKNTKTNMHIFHLILGYVGIAILVVVIYVVVGLWLIGRSADGAQREIE